MKYAQFTLILLALLIPSCAQTHFTRLNDGEVTIYYRDKAAHDVYFASSLDKYKLRAARQERDGLWEVTVPAGKKFTYFYVVDEMITLPDCPLTENDDFGSRNCLYIPDM